MAYVLMLAMLFLCPKAWSSTTRQQQSIIARWTGENICAMGAEQFYGLPEAEITDLFESQTGLSYSVIPLEPTDSERISITTHLTAYMGSVCPSEPEHYLEQ